MAASNGPAPQGVAAALLDFSKPVDVPLLDSVVTAFYTASSTQEVRAWGRRLPLPTGATRALGPLRACTALAPPGSDARSLGARTAGRQPAHNCPASTAAAAAGWLPPPGPGALDAPPAALPAQPRTQRWPRHGWSQAPGTHRAAAARLTRSPRLQRQAAEGVLKQFQEHPEAWTRVDAILEGSKNQQTKFFGLQVRAAHPACTQQRLLRADACARAERRRCRSVGWRVGWGPPAAAAARRLRGHARLWQH